VRQPEFIMIVSRQNDEAERFTFFWLRSWAALKEMEGDTVNRVLNF
jgi:hypothetical protein